MNQLFIGMTYLRHGQFPGSADLTLEVADGEGITSLDGDAPNLGTLTDGRLFLASESYPRFAPLTLTLRGADLAFLVRRRRVISFQVVSRDTTVAQIQCTGFANPLTSYGLTVSENCTVPIANQTRTVRKIIVTRRDHLLPDPTQDLRETPLEIYLLAGSLAGLVGANRRDSSSGVVIDDRVILRRDANGELRLRLHATKLDWRFRNGTLTNLRVFGGGGIFSSSAFLTGGGSSVSVAFLDTLP